MTPLGTFATEFDARFRTYLADAESVPPVLLEAVQYSALAPGKRIRPYLVVRCSELVAGRVPEVWPAAAAVECVHAFSLVHDDLPAMDNDDWRRGQPTCHKKFGEAMAILAGDALLVLAFELLTRHIADGNLAARLAFELTQGAGWSGMIGGQAADILGETRPPDLALTKYVHHRKTARLFETACRVGALAGGAHPEAVARLGRFGEMVGRAFQIADDLLDVASPKSLPGETDPENREFAKQTFPACVGIEESRKAARALIEEAVCLLEPFGAAANELRSLGRYVIERSF